MSSHDTIALERAPGNQPVLPQVAALCWRLRESRPEILLITSRDTGRWILPKGWPMEDRSAAEAAAQEAWEEAGIRGVVTAEAMGQYTYAKTRPDADPLTCMVHVFEIKVGSLAKTYPEHRQRKRKWFSPEKAARKVAEPELQELLRNFGLDQPAPAAD